MTWGARWPTLAWPGCSRSVQLETTDPAVAGRRGRRSAPPTTGVPSPRRTSTPQAAAPRSPSNGRRPRQPTTASTPRSRTSGPSESCSMRSLPTASVPMKVGRRGGLMPAGQGLAKSWGEAPTLSPQRKRAPPPPLSLPLARTEQPRDPAAGHLGVPAAAPGVLPGRGLCAHAGVLAEQPRGEARLRCAAGDAGRSPQAPPPRPHVTWGAGRRGWGHSPPACPRRTALATNTHGCRQPGANSDRGLRALTHTLTHTVCVGS